MVKEEIIASLKKTLKELGVDAKITLERPANAYHGDYSTSIALVAAKTLKKSPMELAEQIKNQLSKIKDVEKIEVVKPGFINFWLSQDYLVKELEKVSKTPLHPPLAGSVRGKVMVEFADPNPFKEFHIGHLRNITLGESLCRLLESQGAKVWRVNYQGDVGMHVAKALYGMKNSKVKLEELKKKTTKEKTEFLGKCYAAGNKAYEENEEAKEEIRSINLKVYRQDASIQALWEMGRKWSLDYFEEIYKKVGTKYRRYYFESEVAEPGRKIVLEHVKDGIFEKHEGAVVFRGEGKDLHTRVFVTKEDYATYEAKDMALSGVKYKDFAYDRSIIITAHEQAPYFRVVLAAMEKVFPDLAKKTTHFSFGFVRLKDTKMSSRLGNIITGEWLLDEAKAKIKEQFSEMDSKTAEQVAVGAVKYSMLKFATASDISFSFEESINLEGNSGPYLQYTYARTQSVLAKVKLKVESGKLRVNSQLEPEEVTLLRAMQHFPEVVSGAAESFAPNLLCNYLFELAQSFNLFYQKHSIIEGGDKKEFRLALTSAVGQTLKKGLYLLGIEAPERM